MHKKKIVTKYYQINIREKNFPMQHLGSITQLGKVIYEHHFIYFCHFVSYPRNIHNHQFHILSYAYVDCPSPES